MTGVELPVTGWSEVRGQPAAVETVRAALRAGAVPHAWLLVGPAGVGQRELAALLGAARNCLDPVAADEPCGVCATCRRIAAWSHTAVREYALVGASHTVGDVRDEWIPTASRTLIEGRTRVLLVEAADRMNEAAQNAFLKVLEEPPGDTIWVLDAQDDQALLDTVISRCRRLDLRHWTAVDLRTLADEQVAARHAEGDTGVAAPPGIEHAAMGSPARLRWLLEPDVAAAREVHLGLLRRIAGTDPKHLGVLPTIAAELTSWGKTRRDALGVQHAEQKIEIAQQYGADENGKFPRGAGFPPGVERLLDQRFKRLERHAERETLFFLLDDVASWLRDCLAVATGADERAVINRDRIDDLRRDATLLAPHELLAIQAEVERCREAFDEFNGQPTLQIEHLLYQIVLAVLRRG